MPYFHGQWVDFHGLIGSLLESPLSLMGDTARITLGSAECPSLGPSVCKIELTSAENLAYIVDGHGLVQVAEVGRDSFSLGFAYRSINAPTISEWGGAVTAAAFLFYIRLDAPINDGRMRVVDGQCKARQDQSMHSRVTELEDVEDAILNGIEVESSTDYWITMRFNRAGTCQARLYQRGTGVLVGEKTWTLVDAYPNFLAIGYNGGSSLLSYPQNLYLTDFVFDYTNSLFPILDYTPTFTVTFDSQGGSSVPSQEIESGGLVTEPADPTRTGYTFAGWYHDTKDPPLWNFATDTVTADCNIIAVWTINSYAVSFNSLGGSAVVGQNVNYGGLVTEPADPTKDRCTFGGWFTEEACITEWIFASDIITGIRTLYAKWNILSNRITFDSQGGSSAPYEDIAIGEPIATIPIPSRTGFNFQGWFTQPLGAGTRVLATTIPIADLTVYASWIATTAPVGVCYMTADSGYGDPVAEGSTKTIEVSFFDESGAVMTPNAVTWSLYTSQGIVVHEHLNVPITPASIVRIVLSGADHVSVDWRTERVLVVRATYTSTDGNSLPLVREFRYFVNNIVGP